VDARGSGGDRGEHDLGRRHGEVRPVVLADAEEVEPHLVGERAFVHDVTQHLRLSERTAGGIHRDVAKGIEAQFDRVRHVAPVSVDISPLRARSSTPS
jgi:hypothetical protein